MIITSVTSAILVSLTIVLGFRVGMARRRLKIGIGDQRNIELGTRIAAHQNAVDNIPLILILLALLEYQSAPFWLVASSAALAVIGRCAHALGMSQNPGHSPGRFYGIILTWSIMLWMAAATLYFSFISTV